METLDLHGKSHEEAERLAENFILLNTPPTSITGYSDRMKRIVMKICETHDIECEVNSWNPGEIIIMNW